jgi:hypothetical protein
VIAWRKIDEIPERALPWLLGVARNLARQSHGAAMQARALAGRLADLGWVRKIGAIPSS